MEDSRDCAEADAADATEFALACRLDRIEASALEAAAVSIATVLELVGVDSTVEAELPVLLVTKEDVRDEDIPDDLAIARRGNPQPPVLGADPEKEKPPADNGGSSI